MFCDMCIPGEKDVPHSKEENNLVWFLVLPSNTQERARGVVLIIRASSVACLLSVLHKGKGGGGWHKFRY